MPHNPPPMALDPDSLARLQQADPSLAKVLLLASSRTPFAWRIVEVARTIEKQREYFQAGRSKVNPDAYPDKNDLFRAAKHITGPGMPTSRAADVAIVGADPYHVPTLAYLAGVIRSCSVELGIPIRWGGDFDQDGKLLEPGTFHDLPHFERI